MCRSNSVLEVFALLSRSDLLGGFVRLDVSIFSSFVSISLSDNDVLVSFTGVFPIGEIVCTSTFEWESFGCGGTRRFVSIVSGASTWLLLPNGSSVRFEEGNDDSEGDINLL